MVIKCSKLDKRFKILRIKIRIIMFEIRISGCWSLVTGRRLKIWKLVIRHSYFDIFLFLSWYPLTDESQLSWCPSALTNHLLNKKLPKTNIHQLNLSQQVNSFNVELVTFRHLSSNSTFKLLIIRY